MSSAIIFTTLLSLAAAAQTTTLSVALLGFDNTNVAGSVVAANRDATTLALTCVDITSECGIFPSQTMVIGPSTYNVNMADHGEDRDFTMTQDCKFQGTTAAVCQESAGGSEANFPGSSSTTYEASDILTFAIPITAGADKLGATGAASPTGSQGTTAAPNSSSASAGSASGSAGPSKTGSAPAEQSTNAAAVNGALGGGFVVAAAGVFGGLLL